MSFRIDIATENAAFEDDPSDELARILRKVAHEVESGAGSGPCYDTNGNRVGKWSLS